jgi:hypothetical protein
MTVQIISSAILLVGITIVVVLAFRSLRRSQGSMLRRNREEEGHLRHAAVIRAWLGGGRN